MLETCKLRRKDSTKTRRLTERRAWIAALLAVVCGVGPVRAAGVLNMGLVPGEDPRVMVNDNQVLLEHLQKSLQMDVKPFVATDYNGVIEALRSKKLDIALLGPFSYVLAPARRQSSPSRSCAPFTASTLVSRAPCTWWIQTEKS